MSYSRWINSDFYTYWTSRGGDSKEDQFFIVHSSLVDHVEISVEEAKKYIENPSLLFEIKDLLVRSTDDATELTGYMKEWLQDLDKKYGEE